MDKLNFPVGYSLLMNRDDKQRNYKLAEKLLLEQNFTAAVIVGAIATLLAAVAYGIVTELWSFSLGFAVVGIGIAVGISMQYLGKGIDTKFAVLASVYTILGCALGNVFRNVLIMARGSAKSVLDVFQNTSFSEHINSAILNISVVGWIFWPIAVWCAVYLVKRPLSRSERLAIGTYELQS